MKRAALSLTILFAAGCLLRAQTGAEADNVLARARVRIAETMRRIPKYTCIETIDRSYFAYAAPVAATATHLPCLEAAGKKDAAALRLNATDRVRLEVAEGDVREIYSWPGASRFETGSIDELVNRGPAASGAFGGYVIDVFARNDAQFHFVSARAEGGREIFTYRYEMPQERSRYKVRTDDGWVITAYSGEFDIDAASLELLRMMVEASDLPPATDLCRASTALEFARVRIGDGEFLLPRMSELHLVNRGSGETNSTSVFSSCKEYVAESVLHIDGDEGDSTHGPVAAGKVRPALPQGIRMTLRLDAPIDTDVAAAGDPVTATVTRPVRDPVTNAALLRQGAVAHGRIDRMEHWVAGSPRFVIGIHWNSITEDGATAPFAAIADHSGEMPIMPGRIGSGLQRRPPPIGPPDAVTFPTAEKRHVIPAHSEMRWVTVTVTAQSQ